MIELVEMVEKRPRIIVAGVGGAGTNAVNSMMEQQLAGVEYVVINTDAQALAMSKCPRTLHIGKGVTKGLGTGANPLLGEQAANEDRELIAEALEGADLVFVTAGLGGGTGTGASPVVVDIAKDLSALTVAIVTKPFDFEGSVRRHHAEHGQEELRSRVDTLITIPNQRLLKIVDERTSMKEAFRVSDQVLMQCVQSISDLITQPGLINLDFADIKAIMDSTGGAVMGVGFGKGEGRAMTAFQQASSSPLMEEVVIEGAKGILINITGGPDLTLLEVSNAIEENITKKADPDANIIFGMVINEDMKSEMKVTILATGFRSQQRRVEKPAAAATAESPAPAAPRRPSRDEEINFKTPAYLSRERPFPDFLVESPGGKGTKSPFADIPNVEETSLPSIFGPLGD
ncbi:cell division protein FtsZ [bacterium]|nr:cell division protein FtsZ [bacterium]